MKVISSPQRRRELEDTRSFGDAAALGGAPVQMDFFFLDDLCRCEFA
jgi:hypothetical protein